MMSGSKGLSPTYEQAHVGLDLLTLASFMLRNYETFGILKVIVLCVIIERK